MYIIVLVKKLVLKFDLYEFRLEYRKERFRDTREKGGKTGRRSVSGIIIFREGRVHVYGLCALFRNRNGRRSGCVE